jgi:hypothetical protein
MMDETLLDKREGEINNDHEHTRWVEYWHEGKLVHRSVHVHLKESPALFGELEKF